METNCVPDSIFQSPAFQAHARGVVHMLEMVMGMMLGQDMDGLAEALYSLGSRHVQFGVHPAHYNIVETALLRTLAGALGEQWTDEVRKGWAAVFKFISKAMMSGAGEELEIIKEGQQQNVGSTSNKNKKCATMRLKLPISKEPDNSVSRSQERTSRPRPCRSKSDSPCLPPPTRRRRRSPKRCKSASRRLSDGEEMDFAITEIIFENSTILDVDSARIKSKPFRDDFSCDSSLSSRGSAASRLDEAPQRPTRREEEKIADFSKAHDSSRSSCSFLPDIIVIESTGKILEVQNKRIDSAPKMPRRRPPETDDNVAPITLCKSQSSSSRFTAETIDTTVSYDSEHFRAAYWREETVRVIYEV